jgi:AbrB family looped-hinge helix DNA binding protein
VPAATLTSKGQITIPAPVRIALGLDIGDRIEFVELDKGRFAIIPATVSLRRLKGLIRKPEKPVSIEDMNTAIAQRRAGRILKKK